MGMAAVSAVFAAWANSTQAGANKLTQPQAVIDACLDATQVARTIADWLLFSQGTFDVYRAVGLTQPPSIRPDLTGTCERLTKTDVGPTYLKSVICSPLSNRHIGSTLRASASVLAATSLNASASRCWTACTRTISPRPPSLD